MLKAMRQHARYFYVLFVLVILTFIFWGVGNVDNSSTLSLAVIGPERISIQEFWRAYYGMYDLYKDVYKDEFDEEKQEALKKTVLDSLVNERVLLVAAWDAGITVPDAELEDAIVNDPTFIRDGAFSSQVYENFLRLKRITPEYFESVRRRELILQKMRRLVEESVDLGPSQFGGPMGDEKLAGTVRKALLDKKREAALASFVEGYKRKLNIQVNAELVL